MGAVGSGGVMLVASSWFGAAGPLVASLLLASVLLEVQPLLAPMMTPWSFVRLLVLPTPSRWGDSRANRAVLAAGTDGQRLAAGLHQLERGQSDELEGSGGVETGSHPVPTAARRPMQGRSA